ncbi:MAG: hypothetical protein DBX55_08145 [Verrucomicrobia bacterium]|nr:MAG: hypothetical protein DBX55_08145 [Verrucomicrobiota bacterium]
MTKTKPDRRNPFMKNTFRKCVSLLGVLSLAAPSAFSTDYYLNGDIRQLHADIAWEDTSGYWYLSNGTSDPYDGVPEISSSDNLIFDYIGEAYGGGGNGGNIILSSDLNVNSLRNNIAVGISAQTEVNVNISGDLSMIRYVNAFSGAINLTAANVHVSQGAFFGGLGTSGLGISISAIKSLNVTGVFSTSSSAGQQPAVFYANGVENHGIDNADANINILTGTLEGTSGALFYGASDTQSTRTIAQDGFLSVNRVTGTASIGIAGNSSSTGVLTAVFKTTVDSISTGGFYETGAGKSKIALVSKGVFSQSFEGATMQFTGGVRMIGGGLFLNYADDSGVSHGRLSFEKDNSFAIASFGNSNESVGGTFVFDDIDVSSGGELVVRFSDRATFDSISLSSGGIGGTGTLVIDFGTANAEDLAKLISGSAEEGIRIVSWEAGNACSANVAAAVSLFEYEGAEYVFRSASADDGLYVAYVAVPEPAFAAAILGALSAAFAMRGRRR